MAAKADADCPVARHGPMGAAASALATGGAGRVVRAVKLALAAALRADTAVAALVPGAQIFAVERATLPTLPSIELIGVSSARVGNGPMIRHELAVEATVSHRSEDGADELLDGIVAAARRRLCDAETSERPIALESREGVLVTLRGSRWSVSAAGSAGVIRGASIEVSAEVAE